MACGVCYLSTMNDAVMHGGCHEHEYEWAMQASGHGVDAEATQAGADAQERMRPPDTRCVYTMRASNDQATVRQGCCRVVGRGTVRPARDTTSPSLRGNLVRPQPSPASPLLHLHLHLQRGCSQGVVSCRTDMLWAGRCCKQRLFSAPRFAAVRPCSRLSASRKRKRQARLSCNVWVAPTHLTIVPSSSSARRLPPHSHLSPAYCTSFAFFTSTSSTSFTTYISTYITIYITPQPLSYPTIPSSSSACQSRLAYLYIRQFETLPNPHSPHLF